MSKGMASWMHLYKFATKTKMHVGACSKSSVSFTNYIHTIANIS